MTPNQVLGDVITDNKYRDDDEKAVKKNEKKDEKKDEKKSVALKATSSSKGKVKQDTSSEDEGSSLDEEDEKMTLFMKRFGKFMMKTGYHARRKKSSSKNKDDPRKCFNDDDKTPKKKALASIAINDKPSLFDTPSTCFMAMATKVQSNDECGEEDSESDHKDEPSKDELFDMLEDIQTYFDIKRRECKVLRKELKALKKAFDKLNASHEMLEEAHEKLGKAHKKLEKAHSTLEQDEKEILVTCDAGLTYDIIDESFYKPIVVAPTNPSCRTSTSTSSSNHSFTCDASLIVENETLKKEVNELTRALGNAYGGEARLLKSLGSQRFSLNKEGLGYTSKKGC
ncbi:uncharacterized protein [Miscanthus floridulus]|uniref:uncharacterized protein n=1 Tax=Miscanthus floridulus TaxID=154761 RepID=UPI003457EC97